MKQSERKRLGLGVAAVLALGLLGFNAFQESLAVYTHNFDEVRASEGRKLQVPGVPEHGNEAYDPNSGSFEFTMADVETQTKTLRVRSKRIKPANFDQASQVVCIGSWNGDVFEADQLLVKCPSKEVDKMRQAQENQPS